MKTNIAPCPYCSEPALAQPVGDHTFHVICSSAACLARGPYRGTRADAIAIWNNNVRVPDIGADPLKSGVRTPEQVHARLSAGIAVQQPHVPDQTMLAWRIDVSDVISELIWRRAAMKSTEPTCS
jgi:hypothetical protein